MTSKRAIIVWVCVFLVILAATVYAADVRLWRGKRKVIMQAQEVVAESSLTIKDTTYCDFYEPDDSATAWFHGWTDSAVWAQNASGGADSTWEAIFIGDTTPGDHDGWIYFGDDGNWKAHYFGWNDGVDRFEASGDLEANDIYGKKFTDAVASIEFSINSEIELTPGANFDIDISLLGEGSEFRIGQPPSTSQYVEIDRFGVVRFGVGTADTCWLDENLIDFRSNTDEGVIKADTLYGRCVDALDGVRKHGEIPLITGVLYLKQGANMTLTRQADTVEFAASGAGIGDVIYLGAYSFGDDATIDTVIDTDIEVTSAFLITPYDSISPSHLIAKNIRDDTVEIWMGDNLDADGQPYWLFIRNP